MEGERTRFHNAEFILHTHILSMVYCSLDGCSSALSKEIQLEFTRTMNRILFDKTVTAQPGAFPFVTLPEPHVEVVPQTGEYICEALFF